MNILDRPRALIKDFIYVKDNSLSTSFCDEVIKKFDNDCRQKDGVLGAGHKHVDKSIKIQKRFIFQQTLDGKKRIGYFLNH